MIDPNKDPKGYERYLKERDEKRKKEREQKKRDEQVEKLLKSIKTLDSGDFKEGSKVVIYGLQSNPEKNGTTGVLKEYIKEKERWAVKFTDETIKNFKESNLKLVAEEDAAAEDSDGEAIPTSKVYVTNLSATTSPDHLIKLFSQIGAIAKEPTRDDEGRKQGFEDEWPYAVKMYKHLTEGGDALVRFVDRSSARAAIKSYNGYVLCNSKIGVEYAGGGAHTKPDAGTKARERSRSRERLAELAKLRKKLDEERVPREIQGMFYKE